MRTSMSKWVTALHPVKQGGLEDGLDNSGEMKTEASVGAPCLLV